MAAQLDPHRLPPDPRADGRGRAGDLEDARRPPRPTPSRSATLEVAHGPLTAHDASTPTRSRSRSTSCRSSRCSAASPRARRSSRGAQELRVKESDRIATVVDGLRGLGADIEATDDGFVVRGTGGLRGGTIAAHGDHRLAMLGAVAGLASPRGRRGRRDGGRRGLLPGLHAPIWRRADRLASAPRHGHRHRRSRRGRQVHRRARRRRARSASPTSTPARCTAASRCSSARARRDAAPRSRDADDRARRPRAARRPRRHRRDPHARRSSEAASRVSADPAVRDGARRASSASCSPTRRLGRRGPRHRHRRRARRRRSRSSSPPRPRSARAAAPTSSAPTSPRCSPSSTSATSATATREHSPLVAAADAVAGRHHRPRPRRRDRPDRHARRRGSGRSRREDRGRRLPERRQVVARQPAHAVARGGRARAARASRATARSSRREWNGRAFTLIDTGGVDLDDERPAGRLDPGPGARGARRRRRSRCSSSTRAPACAPATRRSPTSCAAATCRSSSPPTRSTRRATSPLAHEFHALGLGEPIAVSAAQGLGTGDLLDRLVELLPPERRSADEDDEELVRLAVIGRPNVGKSSLVNRFLGHERVIVSDVAGTTRDAIDTAARGRRPPACVLVDTAGIRRQAKVAGVGRVLHGAALAARGRARRRRARRLRRDRRRHLAGPADRRAGDEVRLRDRARAQQVGPDQRRRVRPRPRARARQPASCACARR